MKNLNSSFDVSFVKVKPVIPVTPVPSAIASFHTPRHSVHSYQLKGVNRKNMYSTRNDGKDIAKKAEAIWRPYGLSQCIPENNEDTKCNSVKRLVLHPSFVFLLAFSLAVCGMNLMMMYNDNSQRYNYTEEKSYALTARVLSKTSDLLATWVYKVESEMKFLKRTLHQVQTELAVAKKELSKDTGSTGHCEVDTLAELLGPMADFAAEKIGGSILATPDTFTYFATPAMASIFGLKFYTSIETTPSVILKGMLEVGDCWAFHGRVGRVVILLARQIYVTAVSIEHIPKALSINGNINSAPKRFELIGTTREMAEEVFLGVFEYDVNGLSRQTFYVDTMNLPIAPIEAVEVSFLSNHGNLDYTCVYRVRIHGNIPAGSLPKQT